MKEREGGRRGNFDCLHHPSHKLCIKTGNSPYAETIIFSTFNLLSFLISQIPSAKVSLFRLHWPTIVKTQLLLRKQHHKGNCNSSSWNRIICALLCWEAALCNPHLTPREGKSTSGLQVPVGQANSKHFQALYFERKIQGCPKNYSQSK